MKNNHAVVHDKWLEKISTGLSLIVLALGFAIMGFVFFTTRHRAEVINGLPFENALSMIDSTISILISATFLAAAYIYWKRYF